MTTIDTMPHADIEGWLQRMGDEDFDRLWVAAVISAVVEGDIDTYQLTSILTMVGDRLKPDRMGLAYKAARAIRDARS